MKKLYRIFILLLAIILLTTFNPRESHIILNKNNDFFKIQNIKILNNLLIKADDINEKLTKIYGRNILFIKANEIKIPLESINFLQKVEVKKKYPNTIIIKVHETKPIAILFKKDEQYFLDSESNMILFNENVAFDNLPNIFGVGAEKDFVIFFDKLKNKNFPIKKIKNFYYFQIGRWDLQLLNSKIIKFPYENTEKAIKKSIELLNNKDFENYNIIDLRIHGKIVVE